MDKPQNNIQVVAPNLKRRLSGVTATIVRLVPLMANEMKVVATGPGLPAEVPCISLLHAATVSRDSWRVWHARRNTEMLLGLVFRHVFRRRYKMLFTSASQRKHSSYTKWLISKMDHVIATSQKTKNYLKQPATVILHGIDTTQFYPPQGRTDLRKKLGLPDKVLIGCYGRIRHQKGTDAFVDAMIIVLRDAPQAVGIIMGRATEKHQGFERDLKEKVAKSGLSDRILFMPEATVDQMPQWYQVLDLFVAPQRWEGFGLTPLESMACGVPVVATRVGAFEELIKEGETGHLIPPDDVPAMAKNILGFLSNGPNADRMGICARKDMLASFDITDEATKIMDVYKKLLPENK